MTDAHATSHAVARTLARRGPAVGVLLLAGLGVGIMLAPGSPTDHASSLKFGVRVSSLRPPVAGFAIPKPRLLADDAQITRWAPVLESTEAHALPSVSSPVVASVSTVTPEGTTNLVVAEGERTIDGATWVHARLAVLPNGLTGWVPRSALGGWEFVDTRLVIDRARLTLTLYRAGAVVFRAPVGIGKPSSPTPPGEFYVRDRLTGYSSPEYGPLAFGTSARSPYETDWPAGGFIGIHGTDQPGLIPGRVSHGCIRLRNSAIIELGRLLPVGTPVIVQ